MRILVTNDDGIHAPGIDVCARIARALSDDVWVVAPEFDQSGVSHSLSLSDPLRLRQIEEKRFAVKGTPTDCVIMAVRHILQDLKPDLVLSGVNRGQNVAEDVGYSGTVAGAMEGTVLGVPSIALSQAYGKETRSHPPYTVAEHYGADVVRRVLDAGIPPGIVVNVNFPNRPIGEVKGIAVTSQGKRNQELLRIDERADGRGNPYYWIAFERRIFETVNGSDLHALDEGRISVTPLRLDMTDEPEMTRLARVFAD
ncbi:5'/3'-nucleotidase SurE [Ancylobacter sp. 6x-1]|uniref:5'-nucleotidase SurE n=1 Tax=Ancylobacter crimeensis TaxID=2579147 RepID=A0ABT0DFV4_9HYPH|nr:5'/3'-nucleotidase SurE [Ancylobacter crimeensis]MCK0198846.1 5'/3'-nucleotidase SurE [Ancylobacter crimeensis]